MTGLIKQKSIVLQFLFSLYCGFNTLNPLSYVGVEDKVGVGVEKEEEEEA